jgi:stage V sporulation protein R
MYGYETRLTPELEDVVRGLEAVARGVGLDPMPTIFELVDYNQLNEIAAYGGFPTRYPHWRWGMEYEQISKSYTYGLSIIYEMVINNNPCYAYLLRGNSMVYQKTVIAHVFGHSDFFKNNYWYSKTNRKMLDQMANHSSAVRGIINDLGHDQVENYIDICLSIDNLIDIHAPFRAKSKTEDKGEQRSPKVTKLAAKTYMDSYVNPLDYLEQQRQQQVVEMAQQRKIPAKPERDVLKFLLDYAPLESWQRTILNIIRDEAYYFAPQGQTKILNEGWATYWHSKMMTQLAPLHGSEIVDYCAHYAGVVASHPNSLNPYKLGVELLRHIERRWDRGQFGIDYVHCRDPKDRANWDTKAGLGQQKLFEVRKIHNDITFLDEFLDEDFCHQHKMFLYDFDRRSGKYLISSREFSKVKAQLLGQLTNFGQPVIEVVDGNFRNRGELLLKHKYETVGLQQDFAQETLRNLFLVWSRPVHIETIVEDVPKRISFDGKSHHTEKV